MFGHTKTCLGSVGTYVSTRERLQQLHPDLPRSVIDAAVNECEGHRGLAYRLLLEPEGFERMVGTAAAMVKSKESVQNYAEEMKLKAIQDDIDARKKAEQMLRKAVHYATKAEKVQQQARKMEAMRPVEVHISSISGVACTIEAMVDWTVEELMQAIKASTHIPVNQQHLIFETVELGTAQQIKEFVVGEADPAKLELTLVRTIKSVTPKDWIQAVRDGDAVTFGAGLAEFATKTFRGTRIERVESGLSVAIEARNDEFVAQCLQAGADPNFIMYVCTECEQPSHRYPVLHMAIQLGDEKMVRLLLEARADPSSESLHMVVTPSRDHDHVTWEPDMSAAARAAMGDNPACLRVLLDLHAAVTIYNLSGKRVAIDLDTIANRECHKMIRALSRRRWRRFSAPEQSPADF